MRHAWSIVALVGLVTLSARAQEPAAALEAPLQTTLGDPIDVVLTVTTARMDTVAVPEQPFAPFEVLEKTVATETSPDGSEATHIFQLRLLCFQTGVHDLGPIRVRVTGADGTLHTLESEVRAIEVASVLANEPDPQLRPATDPVVVEQDDYRLLIGLGALGVLALGALLAWLFLRWWSRRDRPEPAAPPPPPPWETALAELRSHADRRRAAVAEGKTEQWVDAVSDSVRGYLGSRFGFHGLESTTDEIATELSRAKSLSIAPSEAIDFLAQCDLVKFARASLADEASRTLIDDAVGLVERTRPATAIEEGASP